jgi:hypothetical protein
MGHGDFDNAERLGLLNLLTEAVEADPYPLSPRVQLYRQILVRFGPLGGLLPPPAFDCDHYFRPPTMRQRMAAAPPKSDALAVKGLFRDVPQADLLYRWPRASMSLMLLEALNDTLLSG